MANSLATAGLIRFKETYFFLELPNYFPVDRQIVISLPNRLYFVHILEKCVVDERNLLARNGPPVLGTTPI